jgi:hypothetical protein
MYIAVRLECKTILKEINRELNCDLYKCRFATFPACMTENKSEEFPHTFFNKILLEKIINLYKHQHKVPSLQFLCLFSPLTSQTHGQHNCKTTQI